MSTYPSSYDNNLTPEIYMFVFVAGDDWAEDWIQTVVDPDTGVEDEVDFTGCTATMTLKTKESAAATLSLTTANGRLVLGEDEDGNAVDGLVRIVVGNANTDLTPRDYYYDFTVTDSNAKKRTYRRGVVRVLPGYNT